MSWTRAKKAFGQQPLERFQRGLARNTELAGQIPRRWQALAWRKAPIDDARAKLAIDLAHKVAAAMKAELDVHAVVTSNFRKMDIYADQWQV